MRVPGWVDEEQRGEGRTEVLRGEMKEESARWMFGEGPF